MNNLQKTVQPKRGPHMETAILLSFMHKLYESSYGNGTITAKLHSKDNVLDIDTAFKFDHWEIGEAKDNIVLHGEDDMKITVFPQNLVKAEKEEDLFIFNTDELEMVVGFI